HFPSESLQNWQLNLRLGSVLKKALQRFVEFFSSGHELRIWTTTDHYGNTYWHAYDPVTGKSTHLSSEDEMRVWIERRYYT
ncbi:MAG: hypothetical protein LDL41_14180, partial [Coleofasciculus sp. S288]|nr:hypothetical protein [Coleofasciculus sp. S288]